MSEGPPSPAKPDAGRIDWDLSASQARWALAGVLVLAAGLLGRQLATASIASRDATGYYLPLAEAAAAGRWDRATHPAIPPLYPLATGVLSRALGRADDPQELAGRLISAVCALGLVAVVFRLGLAFGNRRVAAAAGLFAAGNLGITHFGAAVGPDVPYALGLAAFCLLAVGWQRDPRWPWAGGLGTLAAVAAMVRSEGVFLVPLAAGVVLLAPRPRGLAAWLRRGGCAVLLLAVAGAICWPRMAQMHAETGSYALDVRLVRFGRPDARPIDPARLAPPRQVGSIAPAPTIHPRPIGERAQEAFESITLIVGYVTCPLIVVWLAAGRGLLPGRKGHWLMLGVLACELAVLAVVGLGKRYVTIVAGPAQVWGALGAVTLAARLAPRLRGRRGPALTPRREMLGLGLLAVALACLSLFSRAEGTRHRELRELGQAALKQFGPGQVLLAQSPEAPYYARGYIVRAAELDDDAPRPPAPAARAELLDVCRRFGVRLIVARAGRPGNAWLAGLIDRGRLPRASVAATARDGKAVAYLIDARKLFAEPTDHD